MFRALLIGLGFAVLVACPPQRCLAQKKALEQPKIVVMNLGELFMKYEKAADAKLEVEKALKPLKEEATQLKLNIQNFQKMLDDPTTPEENKPAFQNAVRLAQRRLEDLDFAARTKISKVQDAQIVALYKDVHEASQQYARENGILLVLGYGAPADDIFNISNIKRKLDGMDQGSLTPIYAHPSVDITQALVERLNEAYRRERKDKAKGDVEADGK